MRDFLYTKFFILATIIFFVLSCGDDEMAQETTLSVDLAELAFKKSDNTAKTVTITTNASKWEASAPSYWWLVFDQTGNTLSVNVLDNDGGDRNATITIIAGDKTEKIKVSQSEMTTLKVNPDKLDFTAMDDEAQTVTVTTNSDNWSYSVSGEWISAARNGSLLSVSVSGNSGDTRTGSILVTAGGISANIEVIQSKKPVVVDGEADFKSASGVYSGITGVFTGKFAMTFVDGEKRLVVEAFTDIFAIPEKFVPANGNYTLASSSALSTFAPGRLADQAPEGSYYTDGKSTVLITAGTISVAVANSQYTVNATLSGINIADDSSITEMVFTYSGEVPFTDNSQKLTYKDYNDELEGTYLGDFNGNNNGYYFLEFKKITGDSNNEKKWDGIILHLFDALAPDPDAARLSPGVYRVRNTAATGTVLQGTLSEGYLVGSYAYSKLKTPDEEGYTLVWFIKNGTVVVESSGSSYTMKGYFAGIDYETGKSFEFAFETTGEIPIKNEADPGSTDTKNVTFNNGSARYYGDYYELGNAMYIVELYDVDNQYVLGLEAFTPKTTASDYFPAGEYTFSDKGNNFTLLPGDYEDSNLSYSFFSAFQSGSLSPPFVPLNKGKVTITRVNDIYTISGEVSGKEIDSKSTVSVQISFNGPLKIEDASSARMAFSAVNGGDRFRMPVIMDKMRTKTLGRRMGTIYHPVR